jgi:hypothetical protein
MPKMWRVSLVFLLTIFVWSVRMSFGQTTLIQENFDDTSFASRGWYDSTGPALSTTNVYAGPSAYECHFAVGGTSCTGGNIGRHALTPTNSIYIAYYIQYSANWVGSQETFHPHMFLFLSNLDGAYDGPAYNYLDAYIENIGDGKTAGVWNGTPHFSIQDGKNINTATVGSQTFNPNGNPIGDNLVGRTESRAVGGCNGDTDSYIGLSTCYSSGGSGSPYWNGKTWVTPGSPTFSDTASVPNYKNNWHLVEAYFQLNSIVGGIGQSDGIIQYWFDGNLVMSHTNIAMRTGAHPTIQFNQMDLLPYIGDGSPVDQYMWLDSLTIATARPAIPPPPPGISAPLAPTNLHIVP